MPQMSSIKGDVSLLNKVPQRAIVSQVARCADRLWLLDDGKLHVGTPRDLADNGSLGNFIEQGNITFDAAHLRINIGESKA